MQELAVILDDNGFKKSADTIDRFRFDLWNYNSNSFNVLYAYANAQNSLDVNDLFFRGFRITLH